MGPLPHCLPLLKAWQLGLPFMVVLAESPSLRPDDEPRDLDGDLLRSRGDCFGDLGGGAKSSTGPDVVTCGLVDAALEEVILAYWVATELLLHDQIPSIAAQDALMASLSDMPLDKYCCQSVRLRHSESRHVRSSGQAPWRGQVRNLTNTK